MSLPYPARRSWLLLTLLLTSLLIPVSLFHHTVTATADPVTTAWERARAANTYRFTSDITQVTLPLATLTNVGRTSRTDKLYLEGQNDLRAERLEMTLWSEGGSVLQAESGLSIRTEAGKSFARRGAEEWEEIDDFTGSIAPQGDFMSYLAAIKDVQAQPGEAHGDIKFTRYTFQIDSPRFADYMHQQMEASLRARGELPPSLRLDVPAYFRDMVGSGELWVSEDGLPLRQILTLQFPPQEEEQVQSQIIVNFSEFGVPGSEAGAGSAESARVEFGLWTQNFGLLLYALPLLLGSVLLLYYRRARLMQITVAVLVIFSQVAGPVLMTYTNVKFFDVQTAKAATQKERQTAAEEERDLRETLGTVEFNPHLSPLENRDSERFEELGDAPVESPVESPQSLNLQSPSLQLADSGTDSDGDTLTDFAEERIGTSSIISDTDSDGLRDNVEVAGFTFGGQTWHTNPEAADSNGDGQGDLLEWGLNADRSPRSIPLDTDNDGFPDLFDDDNDGDGVPDNKDLAPFVKGAVAYSEATPLQLTVNNLTVGKPTFVEFQLRPQDEKQLWFAFNVLDWPQDSEGQVRDVDGKTYADIATSTNGLAPAAGEANGDMKVIPMLEIRIPANSANLPAQSDLTPFNISVNNFAADGQTKVAYVPLSIVTDEKTGQRVAFSGQMRYLPTGTWLNAHQVRLAWVVQALVDMPCDKATDLSADCQADGYYNNVPQPIHSYYGDWALTGLTVREEHGAKMAIVYEDPAVDDNKKEDKALWALSFVLDHHFALGRDDNQDHRRDLTIDDFATRFDRDNNPNAQQRFDIPNILQVQTQSYATLDQAVASTTMTETGKILNTVFKPPVTADRAIKPLLLFAQESSARGLTLDVAGVSDYVTQNGSAVTLDMAPAGQPALTTSVTAGLKWMGYCTPDTGEVAFQPCTPDQYWDELERRYAGLTAEPGETDPTLAAGRLMMAHLYYMGFSSGYYGTVQDGGQILSGLYSLEGEDATATKVRASLQGLAAGPFVASYSFGRVLAAYIKTAEGYKTLAGSFTEFLGVMKRGVDTAKGMMPKSVNATPAARKVALQNLATARRAAFYARVGPLAAAGTVLMVIAQIVSLIPDLPTTVRSVVGGLSIALNIAITIVLPIVEVGIALRTAGLAALKFLTTAFAITNAVRIGSVVGLAISALVIWGFFFHAMRTGNLKAGDPALNRAFFEAVAATVVAILLTILAVNPIGLIIAAIIGIIDLILTLICELGVDKLREAPGLDSACFTLTTALTKVLSKLLYSYDLMVNLERTDLMVTDTPQVTLADASKGYVAGNRISVVLPVTTTAVHKDPDPNNGVLIYPYMYFFSQDNLKRSAFTYSLTANGNATPAVGLDQMKERWQNVRQDHTYLLSPMYRGELRTVPEALTNLPLSVGINATVPFTLNMSFAVPAYECWTLLVIPICYNREFKGDNHLPINALKYDVFPATLDAFLALGPKSNSGLGQSWDRRFGSLPDADGDGLRSFIYNGLDPNDATPDADGDGLNDRFELEKQSGGEMMSPIQRDTDNDSLTDLQETRLGSDPNVADSDNDGLKDGEEVYHLRYNPDTGLPTTTWEGGWDVTINTPTPFTVRVSSDPFNADSDGDGLSDQAERQLAQDANPAKRVDNQNRPYHPGVPNSPPLALLVETDDFDGFLAPGQSLRYTNTVIAHTAVAPGVLNVTPPAILGSARNPVALGFNPLTFSSTQTVTVPINITVVPGIGTQQTRLTSTASTRLKDTGVPGWAFAPVTTEAPLGGIVSPNVPAYSAVTASRPDRQDQFHITALAFDNGGDVGRGDILNYTVPGGSIRAIENDANNTAALMGNDPPSIATNANGDSLAVWGQLRYCNTITFNSLKVVTAGADNGTSGIEPVITFKPFRMAESVIWRWDTGGGTNDMTSGQQRGPSAFGFPITLPYCDGAVTVSVHESDATTSELVGSKGVDLFHPPAGGRLTFSGAGHTIELDVTVPLLDDNVIAGALLGPDGQIKRSLTFPRSPVPTTYKTLNFGPKVASNGNGFLVTYESYAQDVVAGTRGNSQVVVQAFDQAGNAIGNSYRDAGSTQPSTIQTNLVALAVAWIGNTYRVIWQDRRGPDVYAANVPASGQPLSNPELITSSALANAGANHTPGLAYDPIRGRTLLLYPASNRQILGRVYEGDTLVEGPKVINLAQYPAARSPQVAWHPGYQGWLLSYQDHTTSQRHVFVPLDRNGNLAFAHTTGFFLDARDNSLACPAIQSYPLVDLRFEELPGATTFADRSGRSNNATCTGATCPIAGVTGAPNAPLSDYAVRFDGVDDSLTLTRTVQDDFTIAFWLKAPTANTQQMLVDGGRPTTAGFQIFLNNGALAVNVPGFDAQMNGRIDDGQWHFVAINRNKTTGRVEAYVDGNGVIGVPGTANIALNGAPDLRIGKNRDATQPLRAALDHLQIFPTALAQDVVQGLYNRTVQSYCVAAGVRDSNVWWSKVQANQQETRGGRLSVSNGLTLTIDSDLPTAQITAIQNNEIVGSGQVIGGTASDATAGVELVEVSINNGAWTPVEGTNAWAFSLAGQNGALSLRVRATDRVGNVGAPSAPLNLTVDSVAPVVTITVPPTTLKPTKNATGRWQVNLAGTASDTSGIKADSLLVRLEQQSGVGMPQIIQPATLNGTNWTINYLLDAGLYDPTGNYTVTVQASDNVGNSATPAKTVLRLDGRGPNVALNNSDATRQVISQTLTLGGVISDTNSIVGIDKLEIAFTPVEQLAALPAGLTGEQAEARLNRVWTPVTLARRGAGVATTTWSYPIPIGLENLYQIDLRGTDMLGNVAISANLWRGMIDTTAPRVVMTAKVTGTSFVNRAGSRNYEVRFVCAAVDRNLNEATFDCPGKSVAVPTRSFANIPVLQTLFPDLTIRNGLAISYTLWTPTTNPAATVRACDSLGRCAQASTPALATDAQAQVSSAQSLAASPQAVIVAPTAGSFVAANETISVTIAAEAAASLKEVTISLDGTKVQTLNFAQGDAVTSVQRTIGIAVASEGSHTLVAQATDWVGVTQTTLFPVAFTLDKAAPSVTIDTSALTIADTWQPQSGILRFNGTANDSVELAAVQIREGDNAFVDANFAGGLWQTALSVPDPEGRTLQITVRAIDRAGRSSEVIQPIATNLSDANAPNTTIASGPANPNSSTAASFVFSGSTNAVVFECQLDGGTYNPCASPTSYTGLSKGGHTFRVRAIDSRGFPDLSPAEFTWTISASTIDATISNGPSNPTTERSASFVFSGNGATGFECSLDGAAFVACVSPQNYSGLGYGPHSFQVRGRSGNTVGAAASYAWTINNRAPVAASQIVTTASGSSITITLGATDEEPLTYKLIDQPTRGVVQGTPPLLTYTSDSGFVGTDKFTFVADDGLVTSTVATVTINVTPGGSTANNLYLPVIRR